jgi:hypothetical protein
METKIPIRISLHKGKLLKLLVFSIIFLAAGLWMIIAQPQISNPVFNNIFIKVIAAYGSAIMGLLGIYFFTKKLFDKRPGIIIDSRGLTDNSGAISVGLIPWNDIDEIFESTVQASLASKQRFITIGLKNPDKYILAETNFLKRKMMSLNLRSYGSPVHVTTNGLNIKHEVLLQLMIENLEKHRKEN